MHLTAEASVLTCSVHLKRKVVVKNLSFDLAGTKHCLIMATGSLVGGVIKTHAEINPETSFPDSYLF
ncbi:hypothetical protein BV898_09393 [Hypsibius exemplaris]|uniref:Uncharacterized protein n=1 Tax=Hypsibius exemplaris TaxID=2072580 RepID=A0A1W0WMJ9_HYPEX|nr:hypothetical protein BV898_09393 [Hypsibius exemplaris]